MLRKTAICLVLFGCILWVGNAESAIQFKNAIVPGYINNLEDDDAEVLYDVDLSGTVTVGDLILTIFTSPVIDPEGAAPPPSTDIGAGSAYNELTGVSLIKVGAVAGTPITIGGIVHDQFSYVAPTAAEWTFATTSPIYGLDGTTLVSPTSAGTMAVIYDDAAQDFDRDNSVKTGMLSASGGTMAWELGFSGPLDINGNATPAAGEGWTAFAPVTFQFSGAATFQFALDELLVGPAGTKLYPTTQFGGEAPFGFPLAKVQGSGDFEPASTTSGFAVFSDTDIYVYVPEPATILIWATFGAIGLFASIRYRRKA